MEPTSQPWTAGPPWDYSYWEDWGNWSGEVCEEEEEADWEASFSLLPALYLLVFVLGLAGNGLVLLTVWRGGGGGGGVAGGGAHRRRWADAYLAHLALADLAFVVTLPLWAASTAQRFHWPFGAALCKASSYLVLLNMFASAFCLGALSMERYLAVARALPRSERPHARPRASRVLALGAVWVLAAVLALPALLLRDTRPADTGAADTGSAAEPRMECDMDFSHVAHGPEDEARWLAALSLATTALGFVLPLLLMALCYCSVGLTLRRHFQRQEDLEGRPGQRRRLLRILVALVAVFAACWLPFHLLKSLYVLHWVGLLRLPCAVRAMVVRLHPYATCLAYLNSCLNPFLYAFFDARFRARARGLLGLGRQACPRAGSAQAGSLSSTLSGQTQKSELPSLLLGTKV